MKTTITLLIVCVMGAFAACNAQTSKTQSNETEAIQKDSGNQMNLLDEQTKMFNQAFTLAGASPDENPTGGADNYLDIIEKLEGSEELKQQLREKYNLYDTSLDPTKKEELKVNFNKMLDKAMEKSLSEQ